MANIDGRFGETSDPYEIAGAEHLAERRQLLTNMPLIEAHHDAVGRAARVDD